MPKNLLFRNILYALAIAAGGFVLLNLAFILDALFQNAIDGLINMAFAIGPEAYIPWYPPLKHVSFAILIGLFSWLVFRSKMRVLFKATFMTVPTAVVLVTIGMFLYRWPIIQFSVGGLAIAATLYAFHRTRQPWLYWYSVILIVLTLSIFTLAGGEI